MALSARQRIARTLAKSIAPRKPSLVHEWADENRILSGKGSAEPGRWRTSRNPPLQEPMDAMSARSGVHEVVLKWPVQFGKTEIALNVIGCYIDRTPCPIMVALPGDPSREKWVSQKFNPMLESCDAVQRALKSTSSRDSANQRYFKDFAGGLIYIEHAGSPQRLKSNSVRLLIVDELDEFAANTPAGDDPVQMLDERTSAFPATYKRLYISSPSIKGVSRIDKKWEESDQRSLHVPCPHCGELQVLEWEGLQWTPDAKHCWFACKHNGCMIEEHHKTQMIRWGRWIPANPDSAIRGYTINCLYYQIGLGPRWLDLVHEWLRAQGDPAKLKTFINSRLAQSWEDPAMRRVKHNIIRDRAERYPLRVAPAQVLAVTAGSDTQDNRLAGQILGWGRGMACWTLDYVEFPGDPADDAVWLSMIEWLNKPIEHELGGLIRVEACAFDMGGHRTEAVKAFVRKGLVRRPMAIFGAVPNNAPVLGKSKLADINWRGQLDKRGVHIWQVGTVAAKHHLYSLLSTDADRPADLRRVHFSDQLDPEFFQGVTAEVYDPKTNRFVKKYTRNEPLDTWVYGYAAAHHPELRLHRLSKADWDARERQLAVKAEVNGPVPAVLIPNTNAAPAPLSQKQAAQRTAAAGPTEAPNPFASDSWRGRW